MSELDDVIEELEHSEERRLIAESKLSKKIIQCKALEAERDKYKKVIKDYLEGNYIHPRTYRPKDCPHGQGYWEECEQCNYEHFVKALEETP